MKQNPLNTMPNNEWEWYQIYEAKSVKHDAQQRVGMKQRNRQGIAKTRPCRFSFEAACPKF